MPLIHIAMRAGKPEAYRQAIFDTLYRAMRETFNVPEDDQFMTITEHEAANFRYSPTYLGVARVFDLEPSQVMPVAAHQDDLAAARACGLQTAYIERPLEFGAGQPKDVSPDPANTWHARNFLDLADQLGCP